MKKLYALFVVLFTTLPFLSAGNVITYTATEKLYETQNPNINGNGIYIYGFNTYIRKHTYSNGVGTIEFVKDVTQIGKNAFSYCTGLTSITIPESVTSIEQYAFYGCTGLTSITIGNSVTSVGDYAFYGCTGLTSITIGNSVTSIGVRAFYNCTGLKSVSINSDAIVSANNDDSKSLSSIFGSQVTEYIFGDDVHSIRDNEFSKNRNLTSVTIGNGVTNIGEYAFDGCTGLSSITIGNSVTSIGDYAFHNCDSLKKVNYIGDVQGWFNIIHTQNSPIRYSRNLYLNDVLLTELVIPDGVTEISAAFAYDTCLTSVTIPNSVTSIGEYAFYGCTGLTSVTIPNSVTSIGNWAFYGCTGLTSVTIPNSVTSIGYGAFSGCTGLTSVTIPNSVTSIGNYAFSGCTGLTSVAIGNNVTSIEEETFDGCTNITSVVWNVRSYKDDIPTLEAYHPFYDSRDHITSFSFGDAVDTIPARLCYGMKKLTSISIGSNVRNIEKDVFSGCTSLNSVIWNAKSCADFVNDPFYRIRDQITSFTFGDTVDSIPARLCYGMSNLTSITISEKVTHIGGSAFYRCTDLTSVIWNAKSYGYVGSYNDRPFSDIEGQITSFSFGDAVDIIPEYLCNGMSNLTSITIPNSVTSIGEGAFYGCTGLTSIDVESGNTIYDSRNNCNAIIETATNTLVQGVKTTIIPNSVTSIGEGAFAFCDGLTSITIPNSVTSIEWCAFYDCMGLTSVTIPNSVTSIGDGAFKGCTGLTSITIPNSVTSIGESAFASCTGLTSITIPNSVTSIGESAFDSCTGLTSLIISNSVTSIEDWTFYKCSSLTSVTIPNSVTSIGKGAFCDCTGLTSITVCAITPPECNGYDAFADVPYTIPVHIPCGAKEAYQSALGWRNFKNYIETPNYTLDVTSQNEDMGSVEVTQEPSCDDNKSVFKAVANEGYRFVRWNDGNTDNPRTVVVTQDTTFVAEFAEQLPQYTITVTCDSKQGTVSGSGVYDEGTQVTLTATANEGYEFAQWSNGVTDNPYIFSATQDITLEAKFTATTAVENVSADGDTAARKVIRNGQVYILRNGKVYTVQGQEIKEQ